jgi:hypothetical protein
VEGKDLRGRAGTSGDPALADTVAALRDELRGMRSAARMRAVIEQAKGVLVERHRITLDEAFARLRAMSQEHNVRLVEVAATVVGVAVPAGDDDLPADLPEDVLRSRIPPSPASSRSWRELQGQPDVRAGVLSALVDAVAGATGHGDEAAQVLAELLAAYDVAAVALYRSAADDSLRLVGQHGIPGDLISPWRFIPPSRDIPYIAALLDRRARLWGSREERLEEFPGLRATRSAYEATGTVPVMDGETPMGVVGLMWHGVQVFDDERREGIIRIVQRVGPMLLRNVVAADPELDWLDTLLRLHLDPWLLLETIPSADGVIRDFVVQDVTPILPEGQAWVGRRLLELWPGMTREGVSRALAGLAQSGGSWTMTVATPSDTPWGIPGSRVRAVRLGRRIVVVWRPGRVTDRRSAPGGEAHEGHGGLAAGAR